MQLSNETWTTYSSCYYNIENYDCTKPMVSFDYDETLCEKFTSIMLPNVKEKLLDILKNYNVCIFTNQLGISKKKITQQELQSRLNEFKLKLKEACFSLNIVLNMQIFYSTCDDNYRKPMTRMFKLMKNLLNPIDVVYYCGDAAGRSNDFSRSDLYFANNCLINFKTPEEIFYNTSSDIILKVKILKSYELYNHDIWCNGQLSNNRKIVNYNNIDILNNISLSNTKKTLFLMIGPQASGKTTITDYLSNKFNLGIINADNQKTKSIMKKAFEKYQKDLTLSGIIIDNTNSKKKSREEWINYLNDKSYWDIKIIFIDINKNISFHLTKYRQNYDGNKIPSVAIHSYYKNLEKPNNDEGEIITLNNPISKIKINQNLRFIM